jgi:hypothetical protein
MLGMNNVEFGKLEHDGIDRRSFWEETNAMVSVVSCDPLPFLFVMPNYLPVWMPMNKNK